MDRKRKRHADDAGAGATDAGDAPESQKQRTADVKFYGSAGSFTHKAAATYFGSSISSDAMEESASLDEVFEAVASPGGVKYGVVPWENSVSGVLRNVLVKLVATENVFVVGEVASHETFCLCAKPGTFRRDVRNVYSHPHLLTQADNYLGELEKENSGEKIQRHFTFDSAGACALVTGSSDAAIASREAGLAQGLEVIAEDFSDADSETRYLILSRQRVPRKQVHGAKCTVSFVLQNQHGAMFRCLSCFAFRDINVQRIMSVPLAGKKALVARTSGVDVGKWDYVFVVDFLMAPKAEVNEAALRNLREFATDVQILGEYAEHDTADNTAAAAAYGSSFF